MRREAMATFWSLVRAWPSSSMVSATTAAPCSLDQPHHPLVPRVRPVAVLEVHRVDHRPAAEQLQPGLDDRRLGGVEHERERARGGQPADDLLHVVDAVTADVVDADVEQVGPVAGLVAGDLDAGRPTGPRAWPRGRPWSRWRSCARRWRGTEASCRNGTVWYSEATAGSGRGRRGLDRRPADRLDDLAQVLGRRAAAAADQGEPELLDELGVGLGELGRRQRVGRALLGQHGQPGVGHAGDRDAGVARQVAQVLAHLGRAGGAVQADRVDAQRLERGQRSADLRAEEHGAGGLDGDLDHDGQRTRPPRPARACSRPPRPWPAAGPARSR